MLSIVLEHYETNPRICFTQSISDVFDYSRYVNWVPVFPQSGSTTEVGRIQKKVSSLWNSERKNRFGDRSCSHKKLEGVITFTDAYQSSTVDNIYRDADGNDYVNAFVALFPSFPPKWYDTKGRVIEYDTVSVRLGKYTYDTCISYYPYYDTWKTYQGYSVSFNGLRWTGEEFFYFMTVSPRYNSLQEAKDQSLTWLRTHSHSLWITAGSRALVGSLPDLDSLAKRLSNSSEWLDILAANEPQVDSESLFGRLSRDILDSWSPPQVNLPQYFKDLFKTASDLVKVAKSVSKLDIKSISDAYLSYKYGFSLSIRDTLELGHYLTRGAFSYDWASGRAHTYVTQDDWLGMFAEKVYYSMYPSEDLDIVDELFDNDVIGLANAWDSIPFSFCVDWFLNIGDTLEQLDSTSRFNHFPVESCISTIKWERNLLEADVTLLLGEHPAKVAVTFVDYRRTILPHMWVPKLSWDAPSQFNHYMEASALIISSMYRR